MTVIQAAPTLAGIAAERNLGRSRARWALGVLTAVYCINFIDRQILSILLEPIKRDLHLSDSQLGLLSGLAFALFYASFGLPLARLADRVSRRNMIAACLAIWSLMTGVCGLAQTFVQIMLGRVGVAIGEAGASPPAHSLIADLFPHGQRSTALAIYSTGIPIGALIGLVAGGWINQAFNWRVAFMIAGVPGVAAALILLATVKEPLRGASDGGAPPMAPAGVMEALRTLWAIRSYRLLALAAATHAFAAYAWLQWNPAFMIRLHGMKTGMVGLSLGLITGIAGGAGTLIGGYVADRLGRRDPRWYAWAPAAFITLGIPFALAAYAVTGSGLTLLLLIIPGFCGNAFTGPVFGAVQSLSPAPTRAMAAAVLLFIIALIGLGMGPFFVGVASDLIRPAAGVQSLRWALGAAAAAEVAAVAIFMSAARSLPADILYSQRTLP